MADFQIRRKLVSDWEPSALINHRIQADSVCQHRKLNSDNLPEMKWWLHVKSNVECEANYSCKTEEFGAFEFLDGNVKNGEDQSIIDFDGSDHLSVDQPRNVSSTCMKNNNSRMRKIEPLLNNDLHFSPRKKDREEFGFSDGHFMDCDDSEFSVSEKTATGLMGNEKPGPWWRSAGKDELASLVAQKSLEHVENCDLPRPKPKHFGQRFSKGVDIDRDEIKSSSISQKAETCSSNADGYTSGTPNSGCSFQDSSTRFR